MKLVDALVCVIDDDASIREAVCGLLRSEGLRVETYSSADDFLTRDRAEPPGCLVLDVELPGLSGLQLQRELFRQEPHIPIVFLTGHGDISMSVRAIKAGAFEFLTKPFDPEELLDAVQESLLTREYRGPRTKDQESSLSGEIVGLGHAYRALIKQIAVVAPTDSTVLIQGETGTGKELVAREIHKLSRRKEKPLVRVNCASIPKELYESEFFGHVRGAFTGAVKDRMGRFEAAHGGTLFLDEIGEIPIELQSKLLRALQEKQFERVGDERTRRVDVRVVAATNRDLKAEVAAGRFREDLYYRLNVFPLRVCPLRDRREDIPQLARYFVELIAKEMKCTKPRLTEAGVIRLQEYDWPGNIRELRNVIERATILARGKVLEFDLPTAAAPASVAPVLPAYRLGSQANAEPEFMTEPEIQRRERENLRIVLNKTGWKVGGPSGDAELLGIKPTTLISRIKKMGLSRET
ncbi:sigma-54 dependent transcriptional regulator [Verrucomicrobium sp. BvORR106]|uniref:sigma-54-dependent transcriptional regulator n=1 Tax=Verrucomicrobium sp. BvORR106 TaxID=1403819 RepID=UPI00068AFEE3|nr:sigma-54 dependent transcriptional regulator [Verrucomicrobium sp. BvORR106]